MAVADFFETFNTVSQSSGDTDLGSGGAMVLPDMTDSTNTVRGTLRSARARTATFIWSIAATWASGLQAMDNTNAYQVIAGALNSGEWAVPAYFNGTVYYGGSRRIA